jgi:hypothetical protein
MMIAGNDYIDTRLNRESPAPVGRHHGRARGCNDRIIAEAGDDLGVIPLPDALDG